MRFWVAAVFLIVIHFAGTITLFLKINDWDVVQAGDKILVVETETLALILIFQVVGEQDIRMVWNPFAVCAKSFNQMGNP